MKNKNQKKIQYFITVKKRWKLHAWNCLKPNLILVQLIARFNTLHMQEIIINEHSPTLINIFLPWIDFHFCSFVYITKKCKNEQYCKKINSWIISIRFMTKKITWKFNKWKTKNICQKSNHKAAKPYLITAERTLNVFLLNFHSPASNYLPRFAFK